MSKKRPITTAFLSLTIVFSIRLLDSMHASAQVMHHGSQHRDHAGHHHAEGSATAPTGSAMAHESPQGGQMTVMGLHCFEVVYRPKETRVYVYGDDHHPLSARGVQGQLSMEVRGHEKVFRFPLKYVAPQAGSTGHDYLAAAVDVSRIRDGDMTVAVELAGLPNAQQPRASFTQTFALSKIPVKVALLDQSDPPRIAAQKVCVVSGGRLGSMGTPVKVLVDGRPIYLCCKGCLGKVQANPEVYLEKVAPTAPGSGAKTSGSGIVVTTATAADQAAVQAQGKCPVMGTTLGEHGAPSKVTIKGQSLFVCCKGCIPKVEKNPDYYLAKAAELRGGR